jgi:hypothetical protein
MVFVGALFWVFRKGSGGFYHSLQALPFQELSSESQWGEKHE